MTTSHTPGPWDYAPHARAVFSPTKAIARHVDEANARLIAAAPDMLAALRKYDEWITREFVASRRTKILEYIRDDVRAAIAKATGGEP